MAKQIEWTKIIGDKTVYEIFLEKSHLGNSKNEHTKTLYEVLKLHVQGKTAFEIAEKLSFSESRIYDFIYEIREMYDDIQKQFNELPSRCKKKIPDNSLKDCLQYIFETAENKNIKIEIKIY